MRYERSVLPISELPKEVYTNNEEVLLIDMGAHQPAWCLCLWTEQGWFIGGKQDLVDYIRQIQATGEGFAQYMDMPTHFTMPAPLPLPTSQSYRRH